MSLLDAHRSGAVRSPVTLADKIAFEDDLADLDAMLANWRAWGWLTDDLARRAAERRHELLARSRRQRGA